MEVLELNQEVVGQAIKYTYPHFTPLDANGIQSQAVELAGEPVQFSLYY